MSHWLFLLMAIVAFISSANSMPSVHLDRRDHGLTCKSQKDCVDWYTTGSGTCSGGYNALPLKAKGSPEGTYCEKACNERQKKLCAEDKCKKYTTQCNTYPASSNCAKAIEYCRTPIKMSKSYCTRQKIGQPVAYDDKKGTCAIEPKAAKDEKYLIMDFGETKLGPRLHMSCAPLTEKGANDVGEKVYKAIQYKPRECDIKPKTKEYEWVLRCRVHQSNYESLEKTAKEACAAADHPGSKAPVFKSTTKSTTQ